MKRIISNAIDEKNISEASERKYLYGSLALTALLLLAGNVSNIFFSAVCLAGMLFFINRTEYLIAPLIFLTALDDVLLASPGISLSRLFVLILIVFVFIKMIRGGFKHAKILYFSAILCVYIVILSIYSAYGYTSIPYSAVLNIALMYFIVQMQVHSKKIILMQLTVLLCVIPIYIGIVMLSGGLQMVSNRYVLSEDTSSNSYAIGLAQTASLLFAVALLQKLKAVKLVCIVAIGIILLEMFIFGSRTSLIAVAITAVILYLFLHPQKPGVKVKYGGKIVGLAVSILAVILVFNIFGSLFPDMISRFSVEDVEGSHGAERTDIWEILLVNVFPKHWVFGVGFDPINTVTAVSLYRTGHGAHNMYIETLMKTGIVGFIFIFSFMITMLRDILSKLRNNEYILLSVAILITAFCVGIGEDYLSARMLWLGFGLGYMMMNQNTLGEGREG